MIIYNVTFSVDKGISQEWIAWMKEVHIPSLGNLFKSSRILKVLSHEDEESDSFAVQFFSDSMENAEKYYLNDDVQRKFGERVLSYPTLLEEV